MERSYYALACLLPMLCCAAETKQPVAGAAPTGLPPAILRKVDELSAPWNKPDTPGYALAMIRDGIARDRGHDDRVLEQDGSSSLKVYGSIRTANLRARVTQRRSDQDAEDLRMMLWAVGKDKRASARALQCHSGSHPRAIN